MGVFCVCMAQSKFRINIYVLGSSKTIRCPSNSPFYSSTHIAKRHDTCKDPTIRFKFFIQEPVGNKPWVCSQTVGILDSPGGLKRHCWLRIPMPSFYTLHFSGRTEGWSAGWKWLGVAELPHAKR